MNEISETKAVSSYWWVLLVQAILLTILGIIFILNPAETLFTIVQILAFYWIISGVLTIIGVLLGTIIGSKLWGILSGLISIIAGVFMVSHPFFAMVLTTTFWIYFLAIASLFYGVFQLIAGFSTSSERSFGGILFGIINIIFGILLFMFPAAFALSYIWIIGLFLIISGIMLAVTSFRFKTLEAKISE